MARPTLPTPDSAPADPGRWSGASRRSADGSEQAAPVEAVLVGAAAPRNPHRQPPVCLREIVALVALIAICDLTVYHGQGWAGWSLLLIVAPALLLLGSPRPGVGPSLWLIGLMLAILAARAVWCGTALHVPVGAALLLAFAMRLAGQRPYVVETVVFGSQTLWAGYQGLTEHWRFWTQYRPRWVPARLLSVALPLAVGVLFSTLFVLANPDLVAMLGENFSRLLDSLWDRLARFAPGPLQVLFWLAVLWVGVGLLRPVMAVAVEAPPRIGGAKTSAAALYPAFRNTLIVAILVFAAYLIFEFQTLWFRAFPPGFHYSGYAHEGAAWLTIALALATVVLSAIFRGDLLHDPRLPFVKRLARAWSLLNLLLAVAVYNRLFIYIGFNGMTRMRIVGLFGISAVVAGFILVLVKIARHHDFLWLCRRHLWALAAAIYLLAVTPVDAIVVGYNVRRILSGDPAPSVQISVHPISSEGLLLLPPLLDCRDATIREGIRALLAQRHEQAEQQARRRRRLGWTAHQIADERLLQQLRNEREHWSDYEEPEARAAALQHFHEYAYQWY